MTRRVWLGLGFAMPWLAVAAASRGGGALGEAAVPALIVGSIILGFAGLGRLGVPLKGGADPGDVAALGVGALLAGLTFFVVG